jgi:hypothetical protein
MASGAFPISPARNTGLFGWACRRGGTQSEGEAGDLFSLPAGTFAELDLMKLPRLDFFQILDNPFQTVFQLPIIQAISYVRLQIIYFVRRSRIFKQTTVPTTLTTFSTMRLHPRLLMATPTSVGARKGFRPEPLALLPPIPLYRRLLRSHRKHLPREMRLLGDEYVKAEFRAHRNVDNPVHIVSYDGQPAHHFPGERGRERERWMNDGCWILANDAWCASRLDS